MIKPFLDGYADVVYGSRFMEGKPHRILFFWRSIGNKFLTFLSNMMTNLNLTDMETRYKMFTKAIHPSLSIPRPILSEKNHQIFLSETSRADFVYVTTPETKYELDPYTSAQQLDDITTLDIITTGLTSA